MNFDLSDEQNMLAEQVRRLLAERSSPDHLRALIDGDREWDEPLWRELARMGFLGASVPPEYGGLGMTSLDLAMISQELGRANASVPFFSSIVLAANAIIAAGSDDQKKAWLPLLVSGETVATFAYAQWLAGSEGASFDRGKLTGSVAPVADGSVANVAIVVTTGGELVNVSLDQPAVTRTRMESFDQLRAHYAIEFRDADAELLTAGAGDTTVEEILDRASVQASFEGVGGAEACLHMARDYAMERQIFGRPLASFQAIKHKLADIYARVELARSSAFYAGWAADEAVRELPRAAAVARICAVSAFEEAARENIQVHGGIGYTFEANCHFYYRRERTLALHLGARDRWADRLIGAVHEVDTDAGHLAEVA
jgi:acyl-CoA dehydrogenase